MVRWLWGAGGEEEEVEGGVDEEDDAFEVGVVWEGGL